MEHLKLLLRDETGLELSEYAVAAALVILALVASIDGLGDKIAEAIASLTGEIKSE